VLILVRHGESTANAQGLLIGRTDAELTEKGTAQASAVAQLLQHPVRSLRSSPLRRALSTAALLDLGTPIEIDDRWIEVDYGEFDCQPLSGIPARVWREWRDDPGFRPSGGETLAEVDARTAAACAELFATEGQEARSTEGDVVVVSHVTPIKAAVAWALGAAAGAGLSWRLHLHTASVTRIGWGNGVPVLESFNEVAPDRDGTPQSARA
jgi:broad specificity phosphatase PhoE